MLSGFLIGLMLWSIPFHEVEASVRSLDLRWLSVGAVISLTGLAVRGVRWRVLLSERTSVPPIDEVTAIAVLGLALNNVLPGKAGEIVRVGEAARRFRCGLTLAATSVVAERVLDALALLAILGLGLALAPSAAGNSATVLGRTVSGATVATGVRGMTLATVALLMVVVALGFGAVRRAGLRVAAALPFVGPALAERLGPVLERVAVGLAPLRRPTDLIQLLGTTAIVWGGVIVCGMAVARGVDGVDLGLSEALIFTALSIVASAVPSVPGAWGLYEAGGLLALAIPGAAANDAAALAFVFSTHAALYLSVVVPGALAAVWLGWRPGVVMGGD